MKRASPGLIDRIRRICLAFSETSEKLSHGEPTWFARKRVFATLSDNHHNDGNVAVLCPVPEGAQAALIEAYPEHIYKPPYVGSSGWIGIRLNTGFEWKMIAALLDQAHAMAMEKQRRRR